ncbi:hypothetical protein ACFONA_02970 [Sphingomonas hylomeconis]|uniref:Uncharacterized protein n=2 Tax=Sphingomonas hylomeconis TaxID=1395958 RepID=A0ABV7SUX1_9SPHN
MNLSVDPRAANLGRLRLAMWTFFGGLLILPAIAMLFTGELRWTAADFIAAAAIFTALGCSIEAIVWLVDQPFLRAALICAAIAACLAIWADGAVKIF